MRDLPRNDKYRANYKGKKGSQNAVLVGFSTYGGTVIASREWGKRWREWTFPQQKMAAGIIYYTISIGKKGMRGNKDKLLIFPHQNNTDKSFQKNNYMRKDDDDEGKENDDTKGDKLMGQRAIGVVYNPEYERYGNYVLTTICKRYDAVLFIDKTNALSPLNMQEIKDNKDPPRNLSNRPVNDHPDNHHHHHQTPTHLI